MAARTSVLPLDRTGVEALSERFDEPPWMRAFRLRAYEVAEALPMPTTAEEEWRRTDLSGLNLQAFHLDPAVPSGPTAVPELPPGVIFTSLVRAVRDHPDLVGEYFMQRCVRSEESKFRALHGAFWTGGTFLYVPERVQVTVPLTSAVWIQAAGVAVFPHTLVIAEPGSTVTLLDDFGSMVGSWEAFVDPVVELIVKDGATVRYISRQDWLAAVTEIGIVRGRLFRDAQLSTLLAGFGGRITRRNVESLLEGPGASAEMLGLFFGHDGQHFDLQTLQEHRAPHTQSDLLYKHAVKDRARSVFSGMIRVHQGAQKTNAFQANRNLILSAGAKADSIPNLEIMANDLRCTHGSATSRLNEEQLFYLMSRGLPRREAVRMVVEGFFAELFDRVPLPEVRSALEQDIDRKMVQ
ncbi:MAG: Fe-S cluster assembly protein SufD [Armatimonadota bacterium]|nr:Fe-S cluster assembly protein SufD [Armatimonadota bacterium]MDR7451407.1 Fe-S cluster assembly protein SufD [Armatimonadota bacterium]MDR7466443.1 Fe-S cluster assembly protein SufD [Armatimonadota bacterium]MDR7493165.1 Fe-S cluster assembly protein SufD [Armatimonadota bacterium]MDR7500354.1 Fe-S cluster assembly protein SufD [Armatimonadota bacterium]